MTTTPLTVEVNIRRREAKRKVKTNCASVEATIKLASRLGPPAWSAKAQTARNGTLKLVTMSRPVPRYRNRRAYKTILAPEIASAVNITHPR